MSAQSTPLPVIPISDNLVFPKVVQQIEFNSYPLSAINHRALAEQQSCIIVLAKQSLTEKIPTEKIDLDNLCSVGVLAEIIQYMDGMDSPPKLLVEGESRVYLQNISYKENMFTGKYTVLKDEVSPENESLSHHIFKLFKQHLELVGDVPPDTLLAVLDFNRPSELVD